MAQEQDWFAANAPAQAPPADGADWFAANAPTAKIEPPAKPGFFERLGLPTWEDLKAAESDRQMHPVATAFKSALQQIPAVQGAHIISSTLQHAYNGVRDAAQEAQEAGANVAAGGPVWANVGKAASGATHMFLQATPLVGPTVETAGQDFLEGNYAGAAGGGLNAVAQIEAPNLLKGAGAVLDAAGEASAAARAKFATKSITKLIKPMAADLKFGRDPSGAIIKEGLTANSLEDLGAKVYDRARTVGQAIDAKLQTPDNAGKVVNVAPALRPIDAELASAVKRGDRGLYDRLQELKTQLTQDFAEVQKEDGSTTIQPSGPRNLQLSPLEATQFKRAVGDLTRWTGNDPFENDLNRVKASIYGNVKNAVNAAVPEVAGLNERYADLTGAGKAIERRIPVAARNSEFSLSDMGTAGLAGHIAGGPSAALAVMGKSALATTAFKTRMAQLVSPEADSLEALNGDWFARNAPAPVQPRPIPKQLGAAPTELGASATVENPTSPPPYIDATTRAVRKGLLLPEAPREMPASTMTNPTSPPPYIDATTRAVRKGLLLNAAPPEATAEAAPVARKRIDTRRGVQLDSKAVTNADTQQGTGQNGGETFSQPNVPSKATANGSETSVRVPGEDRAYQANYQVRELSDVHPSHNGITFNANPKYALVNDRDYSNPLNQGKVATNSTPGKFDPSYHITDNPDASNGPVVIDSEGHALGGNGRAMILQRVYAQNPVGANAYKMQLMQKADQFGLDRMAIAKMKNPVLVRQINDSEFGMDANGKQTAITDFNKTGTAAMTPAERAIADSRRISQETLDHIATKVENEGADASIADVMRGRSGGEILDRLIKDGVLAPQERAAFANENGLTEAGKERISKLVVGRFFRDPAQLDSTPLSIRNKLESLAAPLARVDGIENWDLTPKMHEALDLLEEARAHGVTNLDDILRQKGLFAESPKYSEEGVQLAKALQTIPAKALTKAMRQYAQDAADAHRPLLLGQTVGPDQAFNEAFGAR